MQSQVVCVLELAAIFIIVSSGESISWVREMRYLGTFFTRSRVFSCSINFW